MSKAILTLLLLVQLAVATLAQGNIVLKGGVEDPAGAAIPEVLISVIGKGKSFIVVTNENGEYLDALACTECGEVRFVVDFETDV